MRRVKIDGKEVFADEYEIVTKEARIHWVNLYDEHGKWFHSHGARVRE